MTRALALEESSSKAGSSTDVQQTYAPWATNDFLSFSWYRDQLCQRLSGLSITIVLVYWCCLLTMKSRKLVFGSLIAALTALVIALAAGNPQGGITSPTPIGSILVPSKSSNHITITPDGGRIVDIDRGQLVVYSPAIPLKETARHPIIPEQKYPLINLLCFPDSKRIIAWGHGQAIHIANIDDGKIIDGYELEGAPYQIALSSSGTYIAVSVLNSPSIIVIDTSSKNRKLLNHGNDRVFCMAFLPGSPQLISCGNMNQKLYLWNAQTGELIKKKEQTGGVFSKMAVSDDGSQMALAGADSCVIWSLPELESIRKYTVNGTIRCLAYRPRSKAVHVGSEPGVLTFFRSHAGCISAWSQDGSRLFAIRAHQSSVEWVGFIPDGTKLYSLGNDVLKAWDYDKLVSK
jgi:WD40 repeat protein